MDYDQASIISNIITTLVTLALLAPVAIGMWTVTVWYAMKAIGISPRESYSGISNNKVILTSVFMLCTAYITGEVFGRFV